MTERKSLVWISVVDSEFDPIKEAEVLALGSEEQRIELHVEEDHWVGESDPNIPIAISVTAEGFEPEQRTVLLRNEVTQVVIGLRKPGQLSYSYGDNKLAFRPMEDV